MDIKTWDDIVREIHGSTELGGCLNTSIDKIAGLLDAERVSVMLLDKESEELSIRAARGISEDIIKSARIKKGEKISGWVAEKKQPLLIEDIEKDARFRKRSEIYHNNSLLSVPLLIRDDVLGVINVNNKTTREVFKKEDLDVLSTISAHVSTAIDKALKYNEASKISQLKMNFITIASHELRTPLTCIKEAMSMLLDGLAGDIKPEQKRFIDMAHENVQRAMVFINEILNISKMEAGRFEMKKDFQDICAATKQVYEELKVEAKKKKINFKLDAPDKTIYMWFDYKQIINALMNLAGDAIKFTQDNGMVNIKLEDLGRLIQISVIDNGPVIREEHIDKTFDKYYSGIRSELRGVKNTGMGLPVVEEIVHLHMGRVWVESHVDQGTKFCFTLPKDVRIL